MISVTVTLYPPLREGRFSKAAVDIDEPATITSLLDHLGINTRMVESIYINSKEGGFDNRLHDGDRVAFLPSIGGG